MAFVRATHLEDQYLLALSFDGLCSRANLGLGLDRRCDALRCIATRLLGRSAVDASLPGYSICVCVCPLGARCGAWDLEYHTLRNTDQKGGVALTLLLLFPCLLLKASFLILHSAGPSCMRLLGSVISIRCSASIIGETRDAFARSLRLWLHTKIGPTLVFPSIHFFSGRHSHPAKGAGRGVERTPEGLHAPGRRTFGRFVPSFPEPGSCVRSVVQRCRTHTLHAHEGKVDDDEKQRKTKQDTASVSQMERGKIGNHTGVLYGRWYGANFSTHHHGRPKWDSNFVRSQAMTRSNHQNEGR